MTTVLVHEPLPPYRPLAELAVAGLRVEWMVGQPTTCSLQVVPGQVGAEAAQVLAAGAPVISVTAGSSQWWGWVTSYREEAGGPAEVRAEDLVGALFARAVTPIDPAPRQLSAGRLLEETLGLAAEQGYPPLPAIEVQDRSRRVVTLQRRAERVDAFLRTLAQAAGAEWLLRLSVGEQLAVEIELADRIASPREASVGPADLARVVYEAEAPPAARSLALGGSGPVASRSSVVVTGAAGGSPVLSGTTIVVTGASTDPATLSRIAAAELPRRPGVAERLHLVLSLPAAQALSPEPGMTLRVQLPDMLAGSGLGRTCRILGYGFDLGAGTCEIVTEVV